ncbi:tyrosine-protein phosphatase non-receptor type substrate 1-like [Elgaria multicarinata webbii]|uniref:tyrosine-protein phosphatase non-receptor type substrate 1-like n=1 Tax=Elgaria multicarinata webbii TaxID=159646 RepID=UPI002FCD6562
MIMGAPGVYSRGLLILLLVPLLLGRWSGAEGQKVEVLQSPGSLSVSAGENLTLTCTLKGVYLPGGVRWHKGSDRRQPTIYSQKEAFSSRVIRVVPGSSTDFTISITDIRPEDAGTYYCVKYRARATGETEEASGEGTVVSVIASPSKPIINAPLSRVAPGTTVTFNCSTGGFSPRDIAVTWLKGTNVIQASETVILPQDGKNSYRAESSVQVQLTREDVMTQLTCRIKHKTVQGVLEERFSLADVLRVPPKVVVKTNPTSPVMLNANVTITCDVLGFYPNDTSLDFFDNNNKSETRKAYPLTQNRDGTFSLNGILEVTATEERNQSVFTCLVRHNSQPPVNETVILTIKAQIGDNGSSSNLGDSDTRMFIIVAVVCVLLVLLVIAVIYLIHARHNKDKDPTSVRLHESEKGSGGTNQDPDPNNVTYADLNFDKAPKKSPRQVVETSQQSEYASIQTAKPAANDDNVTYADLDMVHLSKAPKRPAPQPEEATSEYASVQVQSK